MNTFLLMLSDVMVTHVSLNCALSSSQQVTLPELIGGPGRFPRKPFETDGVVVLIVMIFYDALHPTESEHRWPCVNNKSMNILGKKRYDLNICLGC